jgi:hypothetical protein
VRQTGGPDRQSCYHREHHTHSPRSRIRSLLRLTRMANERGRLAQWTPAHIAKFRPGAAVQ